MNKKLKLYFIAVFTFVFCAFNAALACANNVTVSNIALTEQTALKTVKVQFDINWQNSWRYVNDSASVLTNDFRDAAWVFIKYSNDGGTTWKHAILNAAGHSPGTGTGLSINVPSDLVGAFLERSVRGAGNVSTQSVQLVWNWGANQASDASLNQNNNNVLVKVFAIEMVYIPTGSFYLGSGVQQEIATFFTAPTSYTTPFPITAENADITIGTNAGNLIYANSGTYGGLGASYVGDKTGQVKAAFPKGYQAFYVMKYELSQGAYRDFLNTLTRTQQNARTASQVANQYVMSDSAGVQNRNGIRAPSSIPAGAITFGNDFIPGFGTNQANDGEWIACNFLNWMDLAAYADWAGLRPMTELEYEKAARGPLTPVNYEFAWGSVKYKETGTPVSAGSLNETTDVKGEDGLVHFRGTTGPLRSGFAAGSNYNRLQSGASYYGVMDLSGNVSEMVVTIGNAAGRGFTGTHGNGKLSDAGNADIEFWPGYTGGGPFEVNTATGSGLRGGSWLDATTDTLDISNRSNAAVAVSGRVSTNGGRCARTAP